MINDNTMAIRDSFNSTMVRLKAHGGIFYGSFYRFQFHYGSIKGPPLTSLTVSIPCFNSTMVRLKEDVI